MGIKTKSGSVFPIIVCSSVEQLFRVRPPPFLALVVTHKKNKILTQGKSAPNVVSELMRVMPQNPRDRMTSITNSWQYLQYAQSGFMIQAGLSVKREPMPVKGRLLAAPGVGFGGHDGKGEMVTHRKAGVWDVMRKRFFRPAGIEAWTVVCFESRAQDMVERSVEGLVHEMRNQQTVTTL